MAYWLSKSDPEAYSWNDFLRDKKTSWDGVRNYQARNNLKLMKKGDLVLIYHSQSDKSVMGVTIVTKEYYQDPTTNDDKWVSVELKVQRSLKKIVPLELIKSTEKLKNIGLVKQSRLSVMPLSEDEFKTIIDLGR